MNILRHLYLSTVCRAPDEPAIPEPEVIEPVAEVIPEPAAEIEPAAEPEPAADPTPEPAPQPHGNAGKSPWYMRELAERTAKIDKERTAREASDRRAADLQAIIDRMQTDPAAERPAPSAPPAAKEKDFDAAVKAQAAQDRFYEETANVKAAGEGEFKDFGESLQILNAIGVTSNDFVADLLAVDKPGAHKILDKLAKDPEKAASLVGMDSRRRIAELTRMADAPKTEIKPAAESPKPAISRAPAPKPAISPLAAGPDVDPTTPEGNEKLSDAQWEKWYKSKYMKTA